MFDDLSATSPTVPMLHSPLRATLPNRRATVWLRSLTMVFTIACMNTWTGITASSVCLAQDSLLYFHDDFSDGDPHDGAPTTWQRGVWNAADDYILEGRYVIEDNVSGGSHLTPSYQQFTDFSVRSQAALTKVGEENAWLIMLARTPSRDSYYGGINRAGEIFLGESFQDGSPATVHVRQAMPFDPVTGDVVMQLDVVGDEIMLRAWTVDDPMPIQPQISFRSTRIASGTVTLGVGSAGFDPVSASYEWFEVARILPGDANLDRSLSQLDIDLLAAAIREGTDTKRFDMNQDRQVNDADHVAWVHDLKATWYGDADLDGAFNSSDMVAVLVAGKYETGFEANWAEGDWDGDGSFDSADLVVALVDGGYELERDASTTVAVPEPTGLTVLGIAVLALGSMARRP